MTPFLYKVAKTFYDNNSPALHEFTFVFPNRRAALFFQKYLAEIAGKPIFSPATLTIKELFELLSTYSIADRIELLVTVYEEYKRISKTYETFDDFIYWGQMLIQDFDDVDKFMVDYKDVFRNVLNLKSIHDDFSHLNEKQIEELTKFWENLNLKKENKTKEKFQEAWKILSELYVNFRNRLSISGRVYEGMMFRDVVEKLQQGIINASKAKRCIFVGFNALTTAEIKLMKFLQINHDADFYWDYESEIFKDKQNRASAWIEKNTKQFPSKYTLSTNKDSHSTNSTKTKPTVHLFGVPSGIGQVKYLNSILNKIISDEGIKDSKQAINTAVVLPDETLLLPTLYSIPEEITKINVTMGYSLSLSSISSLIHHISDFQKNLRTLNGEYAFFYRYVKAITSHSLITSICGKSANELNRYIIENNRVLITASEIPDNKILKLIFTPITQWQQAPDYIRNILSNLYSSLTSEKKIEEDHSGDTRSNDLEREFIVQYYKTINRLEDLLKSDLEMSVETFFKLLKNTVNGATVSFAGEPLSGLQIMGVLETRVLDFDNIIMLSMNEGIFPAKSNINSFIPFSIRDAFSLPTYKHQDSIFAYHFYSMISRAKNIYMIYDTRSEMKQTGEVSRYFNQIKYLYHDHYNIIEHPILFDASSPETESISVRKNSESVKKKLHSFTIEGEGSNALSASSINNYIDCSLRFYFTSIVGLSEEEEVEESVSSAHFGTIFHSVMQDIYKPYEGKIVTKEILSEMTKIQSIPQIDRLIQKAFVKSYFKLKDENCAKPLEGQYLLIGEIIRDYVLRTLRSDIKFTPFTYIGSEYSFKKRYTVNDNLTVNIKGFIDRIDRIGDVTRIIDYKTGSDKHSLSNIEQLFDSSKDKRPSHQLQAMLYSLVYQSENPKDMISPALYYIRSMHGNFNPTITFDRHPIQDISIYSEPLKEGINKVLEEIFDESVPFSQTTNEKNCGFCPFTAICNRKKIVL